MKEKKMSLEDNCDRNHSMTKDAGFSFMFTTIENNSVTVNQTKSERSTIMAKCPCLKMDGTSCDTPVNLESLYRQLQDVPAGIKNKLTYEEYQTKVKKNKLTYEEYQTKVKKDKLTYEGYQAKVKTLSIRFANFKNKYLRGNKLDKLKTENPSIVECLYCIIGIGWALVGDSIDDIKYVKGSRTVRLCDWNKCGKVFCCTKGCGERYFATEQKDQINHLRYSQIFFSCQNGLYSRSKLF